MSNFDKEFKKVWATLDRIAEAHEREKAERKAEAERREAERKKAAAEADRRAAEWKAEADKRAAERKAEADKRAAEADKRAADLERQLKRVDKQLGGFTNNYASAMEEEFICALEDEMRIGDIVLHEVRAHRGARYEYDVVADNSEYIVAGEIKHRLTIEDVIRFAEDRLPYFAADCPLLAENRKVLGMVGGGSITKGAQREAEKRGLLILRLKNKKIVVQNPRGARPIPQKH